MRIKRYKKIPDGWVGDWGLTWTEGAILADMLVWDCTLIERAERCFVTEKKVRQAIKKFNTIDGAKELLKSGTKFQKKVEQNSTSKRNKVPHQTEQSSTFSKEKKEIPPTPPIKNKKKTQEEQLLFSPSASDGGEKKEEVKVYSLQYRCQKYFEEEFFKYKGVKYYWDGVDAGNMKMLLRKLKKAYLDRHGVAPTDYELEMFFKEFINSLVIFKPDKFVDEKFTIKDINSQFNVVYPKLLNKNGNASTNAGGRHDSRPSMVERTLNKYAAMYGSGQQDGGIGSQR